ncbi:unnamed protein product, partial [Trichobilharzia regenti]
LSIPRTPKPYFDYSQVEKDYLANKIPADSLRSIVAECLNGLLETVQNDFKDPNLQKLVHDAYPTDGDNKGLSNSGEFIFSLYVYYFYSTFSQTVRCNLP